MEEIGKTFPTLFTKIQTGALQEWTIWVTGEGLEADSPAVIHTRWGQVGGSMQETADRVTSGKNAGKANATTAYEQAVKEAEAKWRKKQEREGYVTDSGRASAGQTDQAGIPPMLAHPLKDVLKNTKYPCDAQRKYNGNRLIAIIEDGEVGLWSRKQTRITGVPHIEAAYRRIFAGVKGRFILDGECYRHGWSLQKISGFFRKQEAKPDHEQLGHFVYDVVEDKEWQHRRLMLNLFGERLAQFPGVPIQLVETVTVDSEVEAWQYHDRWVQEGYEGAILRQLHVPYESGKRSRGLAKLKKFVDAEFQITAVNEGRGKFAGKAVFTCRAANGKEFDCCAPGDMEERARWFRAGSAVVGKPLTVRYFELSEDGTPLFPVGVAVRDYE